MPLPPHTVQSPYSTDINAPKPPRLVTRRGSVSAPDPFAQHIHANKPRHVHSRLTIVCLPSPAEDPPTDFPAPTRSDRSISISAVPTPRARLSFSASSFSNPENSAARKQSHSISGPPVHHRTGHPRQQVVPRPPTLTAQQIRDLASSSLAAQGVPSPRSPFRPVPASYHVPFIQRPEEVSALLSHPPNARLMTLVSLAFPSYNRDVPGEFTQDSAEWSFATLMKYMTTVDRSTVDDIEWISMIRKCICSHNVAMWERVKDVLGVLPELDADNSFYKGGSSRQALKGAIDSPCESGEYEEDSLEELTDFGLNEAWLEPVFPEKASLASPTTGSPHGGMAPIGEEDEPQVEEAEKSNANDDEGEKELEEVDLRNDAPRLLEQVSALRLNTTYRFVPGHVPPADTKVKRVSHPSQPPTTPEGSSESGTATLSSPAVKSHQKIIQNEEQQGQLVHDKSRAATLPTPVHRWSSHHDIQRSSPHQVSSIIEVPPKRRQSTDAAPRFPTTFARLPPAAETPTLAQWFVPAGTVH